MRIVLAEDAALLRAGLVGLLRAAGHEVVAEVERADELVPRVTASVTPELVITDVRMPPGMTDDAEGYASSCQGFYRRLVGRILAG